VRYQVFPEHSLYVVHYFGEIDELGLLRFFDQVFADPSVTPDMNELALVAEGTQFNVSEEGVIRFIKLNADFKSQGTSKTLTAVVKPYFGNDFVVEQMRMLASTAPGAPEEILRFDSIEQALDALNASEVRGLI
jgi:hypothetical protein